MVRSVDSTLVTADDDELVALKVVVALDGSCMNAVLGAGDAIEARVLKLTCSPDQVLCPDRALGHLNVELIVDFLDRLDVSVRADRQLEELRQTEEVFGVLGAGWMLGAQGDRRGRAECNRVEIEHANRVRRERRRDEPGFGGPPFERCTNGVAVENIEVIDAGVMQCHGDADTGRSSADDHGVVELRDEGGLGHGVSS